MSVAVLLQVSQKIISKAALKPDWTLLDSARPTSHIDRHQALTSLAQHISHAAYSSVRATTSYGTDLGTLAGQARFHTMPGSHSQGWAQVMEKDAQMTAGMLGSLLAHEDRGHIHANGASTPDSTRAAHHHSPSRHHDRKVSQGAACLFTIKQLDGPLFDPVTCLGSLAPESAWRALLRRASFAQPQHSM